MKFDRAMEHARAAGALLLLVAAVTASLQPSKKSQPPNEPGAASTATPLSLNAQWWMQQNSDEQQGFLYGYLDCRHAPSSKALIAGYQQSLAQQLGSSHSTQPHAVAEAIAQAEAASRDREASLEQDSPDGTWWGHVNTGWSPKPADADRGYVEGYLECRSVPVTPESVRSYQRRINQFYAAPGHVQEKVAAVFSRLAQSAP